MAIVKGNNAANLLLGFGYILGLVSNDEIFGYQGDDTLMGGKGDDILVGGKGDDKLWGEEGRDLISGALDRDWLRGGAENDVLYGDRGYWDSSMSTDGLFVVSDPDNLGLGKSRYRDTFCFEKSLAENGRDVIRDLDVVTAGKDVYGLSASSSDARFDVLDLRAPLGGRAINAGNVGTFVRIKNGELQIDRDGSSGVDVFRTLADLTKFKPLDSGVPAPDGSSFVSLLSPGDQVFITTGSFQGFIAATA